MVRQAEFTSLANDIASRYTHFLETISGSYNRVILSTDISARSLESFKKDVANIHKQYLEREVTETVTIFDKLKLMIDTDTAKMDIKVVQDEEWLSYLSENTNFLFEAIKLQSSKDVLYINNFLRAKMLQVMTLNNHSAVYSLVSNHRDLAFFYTDKIGRKINSVKYVRTVSRDYFVKNYSDLVIGSAILNGVENVIVNNVDVNHREHGKIISVRGNDDVRLT
jgi:hypothetical protein